MSMRLGLSLLLASMSLLAVDARAQAVDLQVGKTGPDTTAADSDVGYTLTLTNLGPDDATTVVLNDPLPAGMTFVSVQQDSGPSFICTTPGVGNGGSVSCAIGTLASGQGATFSLVAHVPAGTPAGTTFTNIATASNAVFDVNEENDSATASTTIPVPASDASVVKTGPASATADSDVAYTISIANGGPDAATTLAWNDTLPGDMTFVSLVQDSGPMLSCSFPAVGAGGTVSCNTPTFAAGASATFTLVGHIPAGTPSGTTYANSATVGSASFDPNDKNNAASVITAVSDVDVSIVKTGPANAAAGSTISYTLTVANAGPDSATTVQFDDPLPAGTTFVSLIQNNGPPGFSCVRPDPGAGGSVTCSIGVLGPMTSAQFTLTVAVGTTVPNGTALTNTAFVDSESFDRDAGNDQSSAVTTISNSADLAVGKTAAASVGAGQPLTYTITLANNGPDAALATRIDDTLPAGTTFVSLAQAGSALSCTTPPAGSSGTVTCMATSFASGASATLTLVVRVDDVVADSTVLTNTATAATTSPDSNGGNDSASANTAVQNRSDLSVTKSGPATAVAGQDLSYAITVGNSGPSADSATLTDVLPAGTTFVSLAQTAGPGFTCTSPAVGAAGTVSCALASFAIGGSASFTLVVRVGSGLANGAMLSNVATIDGARIDPVPGNDSATTTATVSNLADVVVVKTGPATTAAGQTLAYAITVRNDGASPAIAVAFTDTLPASTTFVSLAQGAGPTFACTAPAVGAGGTVSCSIASLASLTTSTFTLTVRVAATAADGTVIANTVAATTSSSEPTTANNTASSSATVTNTADLSLLKSGPGSTVPGQTLSYTLTASNTGVAPASNVVLSDVLPPQTTFASLAQTSGPAFACTTPAPNAAGTVTCSLASLAGGASASFTLVVNVASGATGSIANSATLASSTADPTPANNASTASAVVGGSAVFVVPAVVPTLSPPVLFGLALLLAVLAPLSLRRRAEPL